jgi:hypothetical protein
MAAWTLTLKGHDDIVIREATPSATRLKWERNRPAEVNLTTQAQDPEPLAIGAALPEGLPRFDALRNGELWFRGEWAPSRIDDGAESSTAALVFRDPLDALAERFTETAPVPFTSVDQGQILWSLINTTNLDEATGIRKGTILPTVTRDRTYEADQKLLDLVTQMTAVIDGPDIFLSYVDEGAIMAAFNVVAELGSVRPSAIFEHGPGTVGNVRSASSYQYRPINRAVVLGENGLRGVAEDVTSQNRYGVRRTTVSASDGTTDQATLNAKAQALLRPVPIEVISFTPNPDSAPQPGMYPTSGDYWVRDTVTFRSSVLDIEAQVRPNSLEIALDQDGREIEHVLTFDDQES